jgi:hypothetical protein
MAGVLATARCPTHTNILVLSGSPTIRHFCAPGHLSPTEPLDR